MEKEKLDSFSKILLATSAINYMANSLNVVNEQIKQVMHQRPSEAHIFAEGVKEKDELLANVVLRMSVIMEDLGECINSCDAICAIDVRATKEVFEIIVHKKDDVDK